MKTVVGIVVLAVAVTGIYLLNDLTRTEDGKSLLHVARELELEVETARPEQRTIVRTVQAPGEVEAFAEVDISSELVAKIVELPVEEGDWVQEGELLCRLDDADFRARVLSGEANVAKLKALILQAEADLAKAERDYARQKEFIESRITSTVEVENYRTILIGAQANLEMRKQELVATEAALESAREDLEKTVIRAPISGVVSQLFAEQGEVVITGTMNNPGTRIMVVSDLSKMQVRCRVDEADAPLVAPGQTARIYLQSDTRRSISGSVLRVGTKGTKPFGRDVVTFETLVLINDDDARVKPGMTANLEIEVARKEDALTIPVQAVVYRKRRDLPEELLKAHDKRQAELDPAARQHLAEYVRLVFCVEDGKAYPRLVEMGINDATSVEITEGITCADTVVTGPYRSLDQLKHGSPVKLTEKPAESEDDAAAGTPAARSDDAAPEDEGAAEDGETARAASGTGESHEQGSADVSPADQD
ncbi:MAG: efflux RND transporter periplasmic adaptor subunit [Phycisphaerae bacterium]